MELISRSRLTIISYDMFAVCVNIERKDLIAVMSIRIYNNDISVKQKIVVLNYGI